MWDSVMDNLGTWLAIGISFLTMILTFLMNWKKLKADLISKSRIEWIQNVRDDYSLYIASIYDATTIEQNKKVGALAGVMRYSVKIQSYFGRGYWDEKMNINIRYSKQSERIIVSSKAEMILKNKKDNKEKNLLICQYIDAVAEETEYFLGKNLLVNKFDSNETLKDDVLDQYGNDTIPTHIKALLQQMHNPKETVKFDDGTEQVTDRTGTMTTNSYTLELNKNTRELTNYISLYLKIEWERAKKGK